MLYKSKEIIAPKTWELLLKIQSDKQFKDFFLVGGTALALQIGHRLSIDLDFFSKDSFSSPKLIDYLFKQYQFNLSTSETDTVLGFIENIKVDFLTHPYPLAQSLFITEGIKMASKVDISAMKLHAIALSGQRLKDFIDIYFLLEQLPLASMLEAYQAKYPQSNLMIALKGLTYFDDLDPQIDPPILQSPLPLSDIKNRLFKAVQNPQKVFNT